MDNRQCFLPGYGGASPERSKSPSGSATITYYPRDWATSGLYADPAADRARLKRALLNLGDSESEAEERLRNRFEAEELPCDLRTLSDALRLESIDRVDLPVIQGIVVFATVCIITFNLIVDLLYAWIDPRIRLS